MSLNETDEAVRRFTLRIIDPDLHRRLTEQAERQDRSMNWLINHALEDYMKRRG